MLNFLGDLLSPVTGAVNWLGNRIGGGVSRMPIIGQGGLGLGRDIQRIGSLPSALFGGSGGQTPPYVTPSAGRQAAGGGSSTVMDEGKSYAPQGKIMNSGFLGQLGGLLGNVVNLGAKAGNVHDALLPAERGQHAFTAAQFANPLLGDVGNLFHGVGDMFSGRQRPQAGAPAPSSQGGPSKIEELKRELKAEEEKLKILDDSKGILKEQRELIEGIEGGEEFEGLGDVGDWTTSPTEKIGPDTSMYGSPDEVSDPFGPQRPTQDEIARETEEFLLGRYPEMQNLDSNEIEVYSQGGLGGTTEAERDAYELAEDPVYNQATALVDAATNGELTSEEIATLPPEAQAHLNEIQSRGNILQGSAQSRPNIQADTGGNPFAPTTPAPPAVVGGVGPTTIPQSRLGSPNATDTFNERPIPEDTRTLDELLNLQPADEDFEPANPFGGSPSVVTGETPVSPEAINPYYMDAVPPDPNVFAPQVDESLRGSVDPQLMMDILNDHPYPVPQNPVPLEGYVPAQAVPADYGPPTAPNPYATPPANPILSAEAASDPNMQANTVSPELDWVGTRLLSGGSPEEVAMEIQATFQDPQQQAVLLSVLEQIMNESAPSPEFPINIDGVPEAPIDYSTGVPQTLPSGSINPAGY